MSEDVLEVKRPELVVPLHDGSDEKFSIVIVHRNRPPYLNICLQSIAVCSANYNYEIVVVDNDSGEESQAFLSQIEDQVRVVRNNKNLYFGPAANRGALACDKLSKYIVFMHCDTVVLSPHWLDYYSGSMATYKSGMVSPEMLKMKIGNYPMEVLHEWCLMFSRECWKECGPFSDELPQLGVTFPVTMRASKKGFRPMSPPEKMVHHYKIFSLDFNEYEVMTDSVAPAIQKFWSEYQSQK
jgi:hypothetical protein